jgi:hypothetical protein
MTTDRTNRYSRRALLKGLGLGLGMLPLLDAGRAASQTVGVIKRFISITWTNGIVPANFYPPAGPLTGTLPPILSPLQPWQSKILAMRGPGIGTAIGGIDSSVMVDAGFRYGGHFTYPSLLTGTWASAKATLPSIDQLIGDQLKAQGFPASPGSSTAALNLGCRPYVSGTSWRAGGIRNAQITDPYKLYTLLFAGSSTPPQIDLRRKSVMDFCLDDFTRFSARLGAEDRVKIAAHLDSIRTIENQLASTLATGCLAPVPPTMGLNFNMNVNYPVQVKAMMDMTAAAVRCDIARAITLDLIDDGGGNSLTFPWLGIPAPDYGAIARQGVAGYPQKTAIDTWFYSQVATLVGQLATNPEGASTSLDNSVVLVCNDMNEGSNEEVTSLPYLIVGSGGGFFKQGTCVQFPTNVPNNRLLTSICHAMGLNVPSVGTTYTGDLDASLKA